MCKFDNSGQFRHNISAKNDCINIQNKVEKMQVYEIKILSRREFSS